MVKKKLSKKNNKLIKTKSNSNKKNKKSFSSKTSNKKELIPKETNFFVQHKPILLFLVKFFLIFFSLELILINFELSFLNNFLTQIIAIFTGTIFFQNQLFTSTGVFTISNSCTGLVSLIILVSITLPLKKIKLMNRLWLIFWGAIILLLINIPRIIFIIYASEIGFNPNFVHELTWFFMSGLILLIWFFGLKLIEKENDFSKFI